MKKALVLSIFLIISVAVCAQIGSVQSGNWNTASTWDCNCIPVVTDNIQIGNHTVTIPTAFAAVGASLLVQSGGILVNQGALSITANNITFNNESEYQHGLNGGAIPIATWQTGSTCRVTGITNSATLSNLSQSFHHFIWDCVSQTIPIHSLNGSLSTVNGDLTIVSTGGTRALSLGSGSSLFNGVVNIQGNLAVIGTSRFILTSSGVISVNVNGNVSISSSSTPFALLFSSSGTATLNVNGSFVKSGLGAVDFGGSASANTTLNLNGDFQFEGGNILRTVSPTSPLASMIRFNGTTQQNYSRSGSASFSSINPLNFSISNGSVLHLGSSTINQASGNFVSDGTVKFGSGDAQDAIRGNIPSLTLQFNSGSTITYNGTLPQYIGSAHPSTSGVNTQIENTEPAGVTLNVNTVIGGDLILQNNSLNLASHTLALNGNFIPNAHFLAINSSSSLVINGSGAFGNLKLSGGNSLNNLTVNRTAGVVNLINDLIVDGTFTQSNGELFLNDKTLTINGPFIRIGGYLQGNSLSTFIVQGAGVLPAAVDFAGIFQKIELNRPSSVLPTNSAFEVTTLNLRNGQFVNTSAMSMSSNGLIHRYDNGSLVATPGCSGFYNVKYLNSGGIFSGPELPSITDVMGDLEVAGGGSVTLLTDVLINDDLIITNGDLLCGSKNITLRGDLLANQLGDFTQSTIIFDGNSEVINPPLLGTIQVNAFKSLLLPSSTSTVIGNVNFEDGSFVEANGGTLEFSGSAVQTFAGGENTLYRVNIDKSNGAPVQLTSALNLLSELSIISANTAFDSNGFLTLISTSDETFDNARIGPLLNGASVTGAVTVQRYMRPGRVYRYISSPVSNVTVADLMDNFPVTGTFSNPSTGVDFPDITGIVSSSPSFYFYNEALSGGIQSGWTNYPSSGLASDNLLLPGRGYAAFIRNNDNADPTTWDLSGEINQGDFNFDITYTSTADGPLVDGWNLVGNPYPATIMWNDIDWVRTNVAQSIAIKDNLGLVNNPGGFLYWDGGVGDFDGRIATGQAFWIQTNGINPVLQVREGAKNTTGSFFRTGGLELSYIKVKLSKGTITDAAYVRLREGAKLERDQYDAVKLDNDLFDISTLSSDNVAMAINALPELSCDQVVNLNVKDLTVGTYSLSIELAGLFNEYNWYVEDKFANNETLLSSGEYVFSVTDDINSKKSDRFQLHTKKVSILDLDVSVFAPEIICNGETAMITIDQSQVGVNYQLDVNGTLNGFLVEGNGSFLSFTVEKDLLADGLNKVKILGSTTCEGRYLNTVLEINRIEPINVTIEEVTPGQLKSNYSSGNQWYLNDIELSGVNTQFIFADESGIYKVKVNKEGCLGEATIEYIINEVGTNQNVSMYPNPVVNTLTIDLPLDNTPRLFEVSDNLGRVLDNKESASNQDKIEIDFSSYSSGLYFVRITSGYNVNVYRVLKM